VSVGRHAAPDPGAFRGSLLRAVLRAGGVVAGVAVVTALVVVLTDPGSPAMIDPTAAPEGSAEADTAPVGIVDAAVEEAGGAATGEGRPGGAGRADDGPGAPSAPTAPGRAAEEEEDDVASDGVTVQVLDGGVGRSAVDEVVLLLEDAGYDVVAVNVARCCYERTTALWSAGREGLAGDLATAIDGIAEVRRNPNLSEVVDVHVVVGTDWGT
jgi:hypothetical protein